MSGFARPNGISAALFMDATEQVVVAAFTNTQELPAHATDHTRVTNARVTEHPTVTSTGHRTFKS